MHAAQNQPTSEPPEVGATWVTTGGVGQDAANGSPGALRDDRGSLSFRDRLALVLDHASVAGPNVS